MKDNNLKFSVLMSTYHRENPQNFQRAMQSVWDEQSIQPNEIVLIEDGVLTDELYQSINHWNKKLGSIFKVISLEKNVGIGNAKNIGIKKCSNELIAIMDTDDISLPSRFKRQLAIFKNKDVDVCGSWIDEFKSDESQIVSCRKVPEQQHNIVKFAKSRSPLNHVTAMYKKTAVLNAGNYSYYRVGEDYNLWAKMLLNGAKFYNIQKTLVNVRIGNGQSSRRSGWRYAICEIKLQYEFLTMRFVSPYIFIKNLIMRVPVCLLPNSIVSFIYKTY